MDLMWLLFLWLLEDIAKSDVSVKRKTKCGLNVGFFFLYLLENIAQLEVSFEKKPHCGLDVAFVYIVTGH